MRPDHDPRALPANTARPHISASYLQRRNEKPCEPHRRARSESAQTSELTEHAHRNRTCGGDLPVSREVHGRRSASGIRSTSTGSPQTSRGGRALRGRNSNENGCFLKDGHKSAPVLAAARSCCTSRIGGAPKTLLYSRLKYDASSYPTRRPALAASRSSPNISRRASWSRVCF